MQPTPGTWLTDSAGERYRVTRWRMGEPPEATVARNRRRYLLAGPRRLGNLHERMRHTIAQAWKADIATTCPDLWDAIFDLEAEIRGTTPANPPVGRRPVRLGSVTGTPPVDTRTRRTPSDHLPLVAAMTYPPGLAKACGDPWSYLLETHSGKQFLFRSAHHTKHEWLHLEGEPVTPFVPAAAVKPNAVTVGARGVDVRLSEIAWIADSES